MRLRKDDLGAIGVDVVDLARLVAGAITRLGGVHPIGVRIAPRYPVQIDGLQSLTQQRRMVMALHHIQHIGGDILGSNVPGLVFARGILPSLHATDAQALALADGVVHQPVVLAQHAAVVEGADFARLHRQVAHQELAERTLPDEADTGGILLGGHMQPRLGGQPAHIALVQAAEREQRLRQLCLIEAVQEVALVLGAVLGLEQLVVDTTVVLPAPHLGVVTGGDALGAQPHGVIEKAAELDLGIAQDVRVGRAPGLVLAQKIGEDALLVLLRKIDHLEVDADDVAHRRNVHQILARRAVLVVVIVLPVLHEQAGDVIALLLEQPGRDR